MPLNIFFFSYIFLHYLFNIILDKISKEKLYDLPDLAHQIHSTGAKRAEAVGVRPEWIPLYFLKSSV